MAPTQISLLTAKKKGKRTAEQRRKTSDKTREIKEGVDAIKTSMQQQAIQLANDQDIDPSRVLRLLSDRFQKKPRAVNPWNARLHAASEWAKENSDVALKGRTALSELAKSEAFEKVAEPVDKDKVEEQVQALKEHRDAKSKPVKWVNDKQIVADVTHTFKRVCEELQNCSDRSELEWGLVFCRSTLQSPYEPMVAGTPAVHQATLAVSKGTFSTLSKRMDGFIVAGIEGALNAVGNDDGKGSLKALLVGTIRDLFVVVWLQKNPGKTEKDAPRLAYKNYPAFRAQWGLELVGYPEDYILPNGDLVPPSSYKTKGELQAVQYAFTHGEVYWRELSAEDWKAAKAESDKAIVAKVQEKKAKKKASERAKETARKGKGKNKDVPTSADRVEDEGEEGEGEA